MHNGTEKGLVSFPHLIKYLGEPFLSLKCFLNYTIVLLDQY